MAHRVCPWWIGYLLVNPLRRLRQDPSAIVGPYVEGGMTVLEPGCGMGFFTLEIARRVGAGGRVIALDLQPRMLAALERRARKAGLADRIEPRRVGPDRLDVGDLEERVDFALAFAVVHEMPDAFGLFQEVLRALRPGGKLLVSEPRGHVSEREFSATVTAAERAGFRVDARPAIASSRSVVLLRPRPG